MTPQEYCAQLERALSPMPPEERQETIRYYLEFLEEASDEERATLGTPEELARRILQENGIPPQTAPESPAPPNNSAMGMFWKIVALTFTSPIWLPLLLAWYIILLSAIIVIACIPLSFAAVLLSGILCFVLVLFHDIPTALLLLGMGVFSAGVLILLWKPLSIAACAIVKFAVFTTKKLWCALFPQKK